MSKTIVYTEARKFVDGKAVEPSHEDSILSYKPIAKWELAIWRRDDDDYVVGYGRETRYSDVDGPEFAMWMPDYVDEDGELYAGLWDIHIVEAADIGDDIEAHMHEEIARLQPH